MSRRVLFLVSQDSWSANARAFVLAARGLAARNFDVMLACKAECPVQVRAVASQIDVVALQPDASAAGGTWQLRKTVQDRSVDAVFVHTDEEHLVASSAVRLGRGGARILRRLPPFAVVESSARVRLASRLAPSALLYSTAADRDAAKDAKTPGVVAPLSVDPTEHERAAPIAKVSIGAPNNSRLIVCVNDGIDPERALAVLRTLALLAPRHPELHLAIIGAAQQDELRMHGAALGVNTKVSFLGEREDELAVIRAADIGWIAATGDAAAFAALDFMACGTPIVAERNQLTEHYVADGIAGLLLAHADATSTAGGVAAFLARDEVRTAMGNAGRARLQREFPYDAMIDGFEAAATTHAAQPA
ncbi:MAG TPA: glycosyltransferase [Gemmatimonadaceae bacterium]|nr:glycosyltransferase [Gemmatimonadaceae bacterium]